MTLKIILSYIYGHSDIHGKIICNTLTYIKHKHMYNICRVWWNRPIGKECNGMDVLYWLRPPANRIMGNNAEALWVIMHSIVASWWFQLEPHKLSLIFSVSKWVYLKILITNIIHFPFGWTYFLFSFGIDQKHLYRNVTLLFIIRHAGIIWDGKWISL
jgi:hypothetical protein